MVIVLLLITGLYNAPPRRRRRRRTDNVPVQPRPGVEAYTLPEGAWVLGLSVPSMRNLVRPGKNGEPPTLASVKIGGSRRIPKAALEALLVVRDEATG